MKIFFILSVLIVWGHFSFSYGSSLLKTYKDLIQQKIDTNNIVKLETFTEFINTFEKSLQKESGKFAGFKPYIASIVTFVKNISLKHSTIIENSVPEYANSFTVNAVTEIGGKSVPVHFTIVSNVQDIEYYSFAVHIPDEIKIADFGPKELEFFDNFFTNRWIVFTLFDHKDSMFGAVQKGLNIVADSDGIIVQKNIMPQLGWLQKFIGKVVPHVRFTSTIPLTIFGLMPFFVGAQLLQGVNFETLQSLFRFKLIIDINKTLYETNVDSTIKAVVLESCNIKLHWGTESGLRDFFNASNAFTWDTGVTMRIKTQLGQDIAAHGSIEFNPIGSIIHTQVDGAIQNPFGIPWVSLHNIGIDFPLNVAGLAITGIAMRAQAGIGKSRFEVAGKIDIGILQSSALVLHGKVEKIPFSAFTQFIEKDNQMFGWLKTLEINNAQVSIACGDTVIAGKEFKSGITVRGQVGDSIIDKKAGFELYAYNTGTYYQLFGNAYLPKINTNSIIFEGVKTNLDSKLQFYHEGPRLEFSYAFDFLFEKFMQALVKANGRVKIGSFFDGIADIDLSTITGMRNVISDWKHFFVALLRDQKLIVKGKLFNTFGAELEIIDLVNKGVYTRISFSQEMVSSWEKALRQMVIKAKESLEKKIVDLDDKIKNFTSAMDKNAIEALDRAHLLTQENENLREKNREIQEQIKKIPWKEIYKVVPLKARQGYNATLIASNADLLNTILMHRSWTQATIEGFNQLRKAKEGVLAALTIIANVTSGGVGLLGIEKVDAYGYLKEMLYEGKPLLLTVECKVMGNKKIISDIPFDGSKPLSSIRDVIWVVMSHILNTGVSKDLIKDIVIEIPPLPEDTIELKQLTAPKKMLALPPSETKIDDSDEIERREKRRESLKSTLLESILKDPIKLHSFLTNYFLKHK